MHIPDFKLERYFAKWEFVAPYLLCSSDVEGFRLPELLELADTESRALWENLSLGYTETAGHPLLRQEIANLYQGIEPDEVVVFAGGEEIIFVMMNVLLQPGDHAVVLWPGYQSLYSIAQSTGVDVTLLPLEAKHHWKLDLEALQAALRPDTRVIVVNFPHNPTGSLPDQETYAKLLQLADERGIYLFSDESYRLLEYAPEDRLPSAVEISSRGITMSVMSKTFALAGLRIGWMISHDADLRRRAIALKDYTTICNSAPSEILSLIALRAIDAVLARNLGIIKENLGHLDHFFARWSQIFAFQRPQAGSIAFPRLLTKQPIEQFSAELVAKQGVLLLPGTIYEHPGNHFRIGFGRKNMLEALERLELFLVQHFR